MAAQNFYIDIDLHKNRLLNVLVNPITAAERNALTSTLSSADKGYTVWSTDELILFTWDGNEWISINISQTLINQITQAYASIITDVQVTSTDTTRTITLDTQSNGPLTASFNYAYTHVQSSSSSTWNVTHNLGKNPSVTIVDTADTEVIGDVQYINLNNLTITFTAAFSGKAYLN